MNSRLTVALCIVLHAVLVLIYVAILATHHAGVYDRPLQLSSGTARTVTTIVSQLFTIVYCAILMLLTQRITLQEFTKRPQTLTAIHDKTSAWLGLGSSLQTLGRQAKLAADFLGVSMITLYLLLIFIVHTTLPGIYGVTTQNVTIFHAYPTMLARQLNASNVFGGYAVSSFDPYAILEVYSMLNVTTAGVADSMIYDIIPVVENAANDGVLVNATTFSVDCALIPDVVQTKFWPPTTDFGEGSPATFTFGFGSGNYSVDIATMGQNQFQVQNAIPNGTGIAPLDPALIVASTCPMVDSAGDNGTAVSINPMWQPIGQQNVTDGIYLFGCNFNAENSTVYVNPQSQSVIQPPSPPMPTRWHEWAAPNASSDPLVQLVSLIISSAPPAPYNPGPVFVTNNTYTAESTTQPSLIDQFLYMDISTGRNASVGASGPVTITELNWSLARAYAALLWYYNSLSATSLNIAFGDATMQGRNQGQVAIPSPVLQERLSVNTTSVSTLPP
ncbi:hypothetical protein NM688_g7973 [Phlebia brevispora]|uniref:Uncharacterized protein n=1 Tax=Phlebia brevispora TaxID=194682 RepID=A0ACC1RZ00_9APHY|nr:hypothetical protein NM688_g7973 [Phlebia brevispora]